jgi:hypothetical protein
METSTLTTAGKDITRLEGVHQALKELMDKAREGIRASRDENIATAIDVFAYGFGLRIMPICDLLSLMRASRDVINDEVRSRYSSQYEDFKEVGNVLRRMGFGAVVRFGENTLGGGIKAGMMRRIVREMKAPLEDRLQLLGETTLSLEEVAQMWEEQGDVLSGAKELIFGNTPAKEMLTAVIERFEREMLTHDEDTHRVLFIVSDGQFTNIDVHPLAEKLHTTGVTVISCFLSEQDHANERELLMAPASHWGKDARLMFELASMLDEDSEIRDLLIRKGWTIYPNARLFVQLNHSVMLKEFVQTIVGPLESQRDLHLLPRGW